MLRKITAVCLATAFSFGLLFGGAVSAETVSDVEAATAENITVDAATDGSYSSYIKQFENASGINSAVSSELNVSLSSEEYGFNIEIPEDGLYTFALNYKASDEGTAELLLGMKIDGKYPFDEAKRLSFPRFWDVADIRTDGLGNEFSPEAVATDAYMEYTATDTSGWSADEYKIWLEKGNHSVALAMVDGNMDLKAVKFTATAKNTYADTNTDGANYSGEPIVIEGENPYLLSSYWLIPKSDSTSAAVTPASTDTNKVNYIGGGNWKSAGETVYWKVNIEQSGYYQLGFTYRQSGVINGSVYRIFKVDGVTPFEESEEIAFKYSTNWQNLVFSSDDEPYKIYLSEGEHILSLTATPGPIADISRNLKDIVSELGDLYMDITMITGESIDNYRDYDLFDNVADMEKRITDCYEGLSQASKSLSALGKQGSGSYDSSIKSMMQVLKKMLDNKYTSHRYVNDFYSKYCSLAASLNEMREMPLDIDRIILASPDTELEFNNQSVIKQVIFSARKFLASFLGDYNNISGTVSDEKHLTIWVNWGRDQAQILNSLIQSDFTPKHSLQVDVKVTNATIVQSVLSGNQPDIILQQPRSEPVNLAIRDVLLDLSEFDDLETVLGRFHDGAEIPYTYKDGVYALPDTQTFYIMFYRTDVFEELGLSVPKTWDEFSAVCRLLSRNNLQVWLPYTQITSNAQVNTGIGSLTLFPSLLLQNGLDLYAEDGRSSCLSNAEVIKMFEYWTDFYTKMKLPVTLDFYNRFRTGTCPLGISQYTTYNTLKAAAPEIEGLWSVSAIPGVIDENGTLNRASSGGGTGCCILKSTKYKSEAWEFLKWWTDDDTQLKYTSNLESILGPTGRVAVSNASAFERLSWDVNMKSNIIEAWQQVTEVPEVPGSYYASRAIDLSFWNVVNQNQNPKDVLLDWSEEVDAEIERKWTQYDKR